MITLTRDEAMDLLDVLEYPGPSWTEGRMKVAEILRTKFNEYPKNKVHPHEFLKAVEGKENFAGIPVLWAEWPTPEPTIDGWPLWSGLPQPETEPVAWGVDEGEGRCISLHDLYFVKEDADHMAELKGTHAKVVALYAAPPQREWVGLTDDEIYEAVENSNSVLVKDMARAIEAKLKEKNT